MKVKESIYINDKGIKYINGKRVATENPTPKTMDFDTAVKYIDKRYHMYQYLILKRFFSFYQRL